MHFHMPVNLYFGPGTLHEVGSIVRDVLKKVKPLLITDKGVLGTGILAPVFDAFEGIRVYDQIEPNPKSDTINRIAQEIREVEPDLVIAAGGGSPLDAGKALALLATNSGDIEDYEGREKYRKDPLPFLAIPTTCGTGSEVTWVSVITDVNRKFKMSIKGPKLYPAAAIVDPDLIRTLPAPIIASTGLDALTHAMEAYLSKPATVITDTQAVKACQLIMGAIENACKDISRHHEDRENLMYGSTIAGFAFGNSDVTAVHCISESIGAVYDVPHGVANSIFLPYVLEYNLEACMPKMGGLARALGVDEADDKSACKKLIQTIRDLSHRLDIPSFRSLDIDPKAFDMLAQMSVQNGSTPSNPRALSKEDFLEIIRNAHAG